MTSQEHYVNFQAAKITTKGLKVMSQAPKVTSQAPYVTFKVLSDPMDTRSNLKPQSDISSTQRAF